MSLAEKQMKFALAVASLIQKAAQMGYQTTLGDAYRDPRVPYGHPKSTHRVRLAIDLNVFNGDERAWRAWAGGTQMVAETD